jgi:hypothetical protein
MVTASPTTALGFSLAGTTIPAGEGVMVVLGLDGTPTGLSGVIVSDPVGQDMGFTYDDGGGGGDGWDGDACSMPDPSIHITSDGSILYNSSTSIAGFQFNVDGATVLGVSGGDAGALGFMMSNSATTVLGFHFLVLVLTDVAPWLNWN